MANPLVSDTRPRKLQLLQLSEIRKMHNAWPFDVGDSSEKYSKSVSCPTASSPSSDTNVLLKDSPFNPLNCGTLFTPASPINVLCN